MFLHNYNTKIVYVIAGQGDEWECWYRSHNEQQWYPTFNGFQYLGVASVHGVPADHWVQGQRGQNWFVEYFDRTDTNDPVKVKKN